MALLQPELPPVQDEDIETNYPYYQPSIPWNHNCGPQYWTPYLYRFCYKGDMDRLKELLVDIYEPKDADLDDVLINIGICHLVGKPEMAYYMITHFSLSWDALKRWGWIILSKTYHNLGAVRSITSTYGFTKEDIEEDVLEMFNDMCCGDVIESPQDIMNSFIWAFTEMGLSRQDGLLALTVAAEHGCSPTASWLINHFNITLFEVYNHDPNPLVLAYDEGHLDTSFTILFKYSSINMLSLPLQLLMHWMCNIILRNSVPGAGPDQVDT
jgi:hypothetical protein